MVSLGHLSGLGGLLLLGTGTCDPTPEEIGANFYLSAPTGSEVAGAYLEVEGSGCPAGMAGGFLLQGIVDTVDVAASPGISVPDAFDSVDGRTYVEVFIELEPGCYAVAATAASEVDLHAGTYVESANCRAPELPLQVVVEAEDHHQGLYGGGDGAGDDDCDDDGLDDDSDDYDDGGCIRDIPIIAMECDDAPAVVLNHPPAFDVEIADKFGFRCERLEVCAVFHDPDNDPLDTQWAQTYGAALHEALAVGPLTQVGVVDGVTQYEQCVEVVSAGPGHYGFAITVYDLFEDGTRIDDALPPDERSRAALDFPLYTGAGVEAHCVAPDGALVPLGAPISRAEDCVYQTPDAYFCDPANAAVDGFDLQHTCPGGVFEPTAVYPDCED